MVTLNGTTIKPSSIEPELTIIGEELEAVDGTITQIRRGNGTKLKWTLTWEKVDAAVRNQLFTIAQVAGPYTFVDEFGVSYSVLPDMQPFSSSWPLLSYGTPYYNVTIKIQEES